MSKIGIHIANDISTVKQIRFIVETLFRKNIRVHLAKLCLQKFLVLARRERFGSAYLKCVVAAQRELLPSLFDGAKIRQMLLFDKKKQLKTCGEQHILQGLFFVCSTLAKSKPFCQSFQWLELRSTAGTALDIARWSINGVENVHILGMHWNEKRHTSDTHFSR